MTSEWNTLRNINSLTANIPMVPPTSPPPTRPDHRTRVPLSGRWHLPQTRKLICNPLTQRIRRPPLFLHSRITSLRKMHPARYIRR